MFSRLLDNPISVKELHGRMRDYRTFVFITVYLGLVGAIVGFIYYLETESYTRFNPDTLQSLGKTIFYMVTILELLMVNSIAPGLTSGAITSERENRTFDLLKTTLISPGELIVGKLLPAIIYLLLLIFITLPIQGAAFILGGVGLEEVAIAMLILIVQSIYRCSLGIFLSSGFKSTKAASVISYGSIPFSILLALGFYVFIQNASPPDGVREKVYIYSLWAIVSINPFLAALVTQLMLVEQQELFLIHVPPLSGPTGYILLSPWIIYVIFSVIMSIFIILASMRLVARPER